MLGDWLFSNMLWSISNTISKTTGILVLTGSIEKLAESILYLLENPDIARQFYEITYKKLLDNFDSDAAFDKWIKLFRNLTTEN